MPIEHLKPGHFFDEERLAALKALAPEAFADGKINWSTLKDALGGELEESEEESEHFGLNWPGKRDARRLAGKPSTGTLVPAKGEGRDEETTKNIYIEGENLEVLKLLRKSYSSKVDIIYLDPPYNTGNDFVYDDDFSEPLQDYLRRTGQVDGEGKATTTNKKADGRFHSKWLSMMYPRLRLARELLRDDGVIFVSIDDNEVHHLKMVMNEVFGEENFIDTIAVELSTTSGPKTVNAQQGTIVKNTEFVHIFQKSIGFDSIKHSPLFDGIESYDTHYSLWLHADGTLGNLADELLKNNTICKELKQYNLLRNNKFSINNMDKLLLLSESANDFINNNLSSIARVDRPPVSAQAVEATVGRWVPFEVDHRTYFLTRLPNGNLQALMPLSLNFRQSDDYKSRFGRTVIRGDLWKGFHQDMGNVAKEGDVEFSNGKKPIRLIKHLIKWANNNKYVTILDFFSGSATTAHSVLDLNREDGGERKYLLVQVPVQLDPKNDEEKAAFQFCQSISKPTNICEIGKERIRRVIDKIKAEKQGELGGIDNLDLGFKVYKLARSHFKQWQNYYGESIEKIDELFAEFADALVPNWRQIENGLLTEILLMEGYPLQSAVTPLPEYPENTVYLVQSEFHANRLLVCLDEKLSPSTVSSLTLAANDTFVCLDSAIDNQFKSRLADKGQVKTI
jgi:adenine-specific DNA-methyltransferase